MEIKDNLSGAKALKVLEQAQLSGDNLSVSGNLDLGGCTGLASLPDNLSVGGSLYLGGCTGLLPKIPKGVQGGVNF